MSAKQARFWGNLITPIHMEFRYAITIQNGSNTSNCWLKVGRRLNASSTGEKRKAKVFRNRKLLLPRMLMQFQEDDECLIQDAGIKIAAVDDKIKFYLG